ncbi:bifunctional folylpolyglutamate synthase/dihydrofolate synthase [Desertibacillus haloalkaliphilus]|uniref:bifunctional folylpolyglutamate synthase/dihydrofolate synthase n=1 Tax=Desertibacillus haloalkaliphilus TaxID=1328930 RepID=UPI001C25266F|nr:folylpolyglutamate synthase/dihydrofolate synthase family protein [Desertibacillus haloalkaliphilus]MBU8905059.1 bifunctional folylpolyglutamate synthase/dihydrofolate synthase [Desertibacillus haloalkaliphilus]
MMNTYEETIEWIHGLLPFGIKPGLKRMEWLLSRLSHPEQKLKTIHIGGTNGKGSTVSFLRHVLAETGLSVGTFTSPYIEVFNERISINGESIPDEDLVAIANQVRPLVEELATTELGSPTEFEVITTIAFVYFATIAKPDIVLVEVGLGGRFDSTNVITPLFSLITNVGHDHMHILGDTISEIAYEKAGIIKQGVPVVTTAEDSEALGVLKNEAERKKAPIYQFYTDFGYKDLHVNELKQSFSFYAQGSHAHEYSIVMKGEHQVKNASLALMAIGLLQKTGLFFIDPEAIRQGLEKTTWLGRFEQVSVDPLVILDGAHNNEGVEALANTIKQTYPDKNVHVLFAATKEKEIDVMLRPLYDVIESITFTTYDFFRAALADDLYQASTFTNKSIHSDWKQAIEKILKSLRKEDVFIITGSLYFISDVRKHLESDL